MESWLSDWMLIPGFKRIHTHIYKYIYNGGNLTAEGFQILVPLPKYEQVGMKKSITPIDVFKINDDDDDDDE